MSICHNFHYTKRAFNIDSNIEKNFITQNAKIPKDDVCFKLRIIATFKNNNVGNKS